MDEDRARPWISPDGRDRWIFIGRKMLTFTESQMEHFRAERMRAFESEMCDHIRKFSPPLCSTLTADQVRAAVRFGIGRAQKFGFDMRGPVRLWLENALVFGSSFDTDPQYPWVAESAGDKSARQMERAESLFKNTVSYRRTVGGERDSLTLQALARIRPFVEQLQPLSRTHLTETIREALATIYPEKVAYLGDEAMSRLIAAGLRTAKRRGISEVRGQVLIVVLMFAFGHGCIGDPLYPWIERTLTDERLPDPDARAARLEVRAMIWLDRVLEHFDVTTPK